MGDLTYFDKSIQFSPLTSFSNFASNWHTPKLFDRLNYKFKVKTVEGKGIEVCSLARNTSGIEGCAGVPGRRLWQVISESIIHMDLHKPNNKLVNAHLEHLSCTNKPWANMNSQYSPWLELEGSHHLPPYSILCAQPQANTQMSFCPGIPKLEF
jgi:hypothetical protein